ncbi:MAG: HAD family phosphatase, partial [Nocardioides sp.]|nr:HAD family phosphatase [Nocardioides sp.]
MAELAAPPPGVEGWRPRLIALDIDGTLLRWVEGGGTVHGEVLPAVRESVRRAVAAGAHIVL